MAMVTVLSESGSTDVEARIVGQAVYVSPADLEQTLGWTLGARGLCREEFCIPVPDRSSIVDEGSVDLTVLASLLGSRSVIDADGAVVAVSIPVQRRLDGLRGRLAPDFTLPDLDGRLRSLSDFGGKRRLLVAFATW